MTDPPRSPKTGGGSYEICPSCRFQFGVSDDDRRISYDDWRKQWIADGMVWSSVVTPPAGWDPVEQLREAGLADA